MFSTVVLGTVGLAPQLHGQTVTWDGETDANWSTANNWSTNVEPVAVNDVVFPAVIPGTGSTITLAAGELANSLTFNNSYTFTGGNLTLTAGGGGNITTAAGTTATLTSVLGGTAGLTKNGPGTLNLNNLANTFTGNILVTGGTLAYLGTNSSADPVALGAGAKTVTLTNNSILSPTITSNPTAGSKSFVIGAGGGTFNVANNVTFTLDDANQFSGTGDLTVTGAGTGLVVLNTQAFNAYTGNTLVNGGTLRLANTNSLGNVAGRTITVNNGGALDIIAANIPQAITISGAGSGNGALFASSGTGSTASAITLAADSSLGGAGALNLSGPISGNFSLTKVGTGITTLSGANTYTGATSITAGTLLFTSAASIGGSGTNLSVSSGATLGTGFAIDQTFLNRIATPANAFVLALAANTTSDLDFNAAGFTSASLGGIGNVTYSGTFTPSGSTYRLGGGGGTLTFSNPNALTGARNLIVANGGTVIVGGDNTFTGGVSIENGTLGVTTIGSIGATSSGLGAAPTVALGTVNLGSGANTGGLRYLGTGETSDRVINLAGTTGGALLDQSGTGLLKFTSNPAFTGVGAKTLTLQGSSAGTGEISGTVAGGIAGSPSPLTINKAGTGTWMLSGAGNTATSLTLAGGVLDIGPNGISVLNTGNNVLQGTAGTSTINATGGGVLTVSSGSVTDGGNIGAASGATLIINSNMAIATAGGAFEIFGGTNSTGVVVVNGTNSFTGNTFLNAGVLQVNSIANALGSGATINIGNGTNTTNTLRYTGTGETIAKTINLSATTGAASIEQAGTGTLASTSNFTATGAGAKTLTLQGSTSGTGLISGAIVDNTAVNRTNLTKAGTGTWTLAGANTFTGNTAVNGGTLQLDYSASNASKLADAGVLTLGGGSIDLAGGNHVEVVASTTLGAGSFSTVTRSSGSSVLALNAITPGTGVVNFTANNIATTDNLNVGGILGGYATVTIGGVTQWAANSTNTADGLIAAFAGPYTDITRLGPSVVPNTATANVQIINGGTSGNITLAGAATQINTLRMDASDGPAVITLPASTLMIGGETGGGILQSGTSGGLTIGSAIGEGILTTGGTANATPAVLNIINDSTGNAITINSVITNNGTDVVSLTKSGAGTLVLANTANTFTGNINVTGGVLAFPGQNGAAGDPNSLGAGSKSIFISNGATVRPTSTSNPTSTNTKAFVIGAGGGTFDVGNGVAFSLDDGGQFSGSGDLTVTGSGTGVVLLNNQSFAFTGNVNVNSATLRLGTNAVLGTTAGRTITVASGAVLDTVSTTGNIPLGVVLNGSGIGGTGALISSGTGSLASNIALASNSSIGGNGTLTLSGSVSGNFALTKAGTGTTTVSGANAHTGGTNVSTGTLRATRLAALPGATSVAAGATLIVNGGGAGEFQTADLGTLLGNATFADNTAVLGIDTSNATGGTFTSPVIGGNPTVTKLGPGTLVMAGASTYTGATNINAGTVVIGSDNALPTSTSVRIGTGASAGNLDVSSFNQSVAGITFASTSAAVTNTVTIGAGKILSVTGAGSLDVGVPAPPTTNNLTTNAAISGPGTLSVDNAAGNMEIGFANGDQNQNPGNFATLDLTGLGNFNGNVNELRLGFGSRIGGTLRLSNTANTITANAIQIANSNVDNGNSSSLQLGAGTNVINATTLLVGQGKAGGTLSFASQVDGSPGTVTIAGKTGGASTTNITVGSMTTVDTAAVTASTMDLRGHAATVQAGALVIGVSNRGTSTGAPTGNLYFDAGTFTANSVNIASKTGNNTGAVGGLLDISGGSFTVNSGGSFTIATRSGTGGTATGALNITGGTVNSNASIFEGAGGANANSTITLDGGTLDLLGNSIGSASNSIDNVNLQSGTLQNVAEINNGAPVNKSTGGTLVVAGTNGYTGATNVNAGTLLVNGILSPGAGIVSVASGATLGGTGTINRDVNVSGILAPGNSPGVLTVNGDVVFGAGSTYAVEVDGLTVGSGYDQLAIGGSGNNLDLAALGNNLSLDIDPSLAAPLGTVFTLASVPDDGAILGVFESLNGAPTSLGQNAFFNAGGYSFLMSYLGAGGGFTGGNDLAIMVIPEPSRALLFLAGLPLIMSRRRNKRKA